MRSLAVVCLVLMLALVSAVDAREVGSPMWGVKGGIGGANMYGDDTGGFRTRIGGLVGAYVEYPLTPLVSLQGEVLYALKGWKNDKICDGCEINQKISYLEIPVLLRINSPAAGEAGPYLIMGPAVNIKVSDSFELSRGAVHVDAEAFEVKGFDIGGVLGGGVEFPAGKYTVSLEIRGAVGATPVYEDFKWDGETREVDAQNMTASFVLGLAF